MRYFAYGSNMLRRRLGDALRAPSAECRGFAVLDRHKLCFHKKGKDGSAKCDAFFTGDASDRVYGVVYEIDDRETDALDRAEDAVRRGYFRREVVVTPSGSNDQLAVESYFANPEFIDDAVKPFHWYKALVVAGVLEHGLDGQYVEMIRRAPSKEDPKSEQSDAVRELLGASWRDYWPET